MEEAAKEHRVRCAISGEVPQVLAGAADRLHPPGSKRSKGVSAGLPIFEYRVDGETVTAATAAPARPKQASSEFYRENSPG